MSAERFSYTLGEGSIRERVIDQPERWNLLMAHVVLAPGEAIPSHPTDSEAFLMVVRGCLTLRVEGVDGLDGDQHPRGSILCLPKGSAMAPRNAGPDTLEFFVLKTPHPAHA